MNSLPRETAQSGGRELNLVSVFSGSARNVWPCHSTKWLAGRMTTSKARAKR